MGFRENLRAELADKGMLVKELAALSGVNKRSIDNYLREDCCMPSADAAVAIAQTLGVTVEYLITGHKPQKRPSFSLFSDPQAILKFLESLNKRDQEIVCNLIKCLKNLEESEKNFTF
jgi:transcriptional regulator with XRE-family HTH domain